MGERLMALFDEIVNQCHAKWIETENKDEILPEWWTVFLGSIPEDVDLLSDAEVLALQILVLQEELKVLRLNA